MTRRRHMDLRFWGTAIVVLLLSACQSAPPRELPAEARVSILTSSDASGERKLVQALKSELGSRATVFSTQHRAARRNFSRYLQGNTDALVISIGPEASKFASTVNARNQVFCRVLDYQAPGLNTPRSRIKGVSVIPDPDRILRTWKSLSPKSTTLGVITGPGLQQTVTDIERAARAHNVKLVHRVARSDKEFFFLASKMAREVDGYWLLPDPRVLSAVTIRRFMENSVKQGKQVIAYTPTLLKIGALMSAEPDNLATAKLLKQMVADSYYRKNDIADGIRYVSVASIHINTLGAERFGLAIPESLKRYRYD